MGIAKRDCEDHSNRREEALQILIGAGVLETCEFHGDSILEGSGVIENAYKLANSKFSDGELSDIFETRTEMTDLIKEVEQEYLTSECGQCARW